MKNFSFYIIILIILLSNTLSANEKEYILRYKPSKLIKYEVYIPTIGSENWYNKKYCNYSINKIDDKLELNIEINKDHSLCITAGWLMPLYLKRNYLINQKGELISANEKKSVIKIFRLIPLSLSEHDDFNSFIPIEFPEHPMVLGKEYIFKYDHKINDKINHLERKIIFKNISPEKIIEIEMTDKVNENNSLLFRGFFNIDNGYWKYWEINLKHGTEWKLFRKFSEIEYIKE